MNMPSNRIERKFITPLGSICCGLNCNGAIDFIGTKKYKNGSSEIFESDGHKIEIVTFQIKLPLYNGCTITDSFGWIFRIEKTIEVYETIETNCLLDGVNAHIAFDTASGEHLEAIEARDNHWVLHIGTEDGEILNSRATNDDWFPSRLRAKVNFDQSITKKNQNGFTTKIPTLYKGEKMHLQYLTAYNHKSAQELNTWFAVDQLKKDLENWIGIW